VSQGGVDDVVIQIGKIFLIGQFAADAGGKLQYSCMNRVMAWINILRPQS